MQRIFLMPSLYVSLLLVGLAGQARATETKTDLQQVVREILATYPSLKTAQYQVDRARQQVAIVESQLGWSLNGSAGVSHDVTAFGTPSDRGDLNLSLDRRLQSGHSVGVRGNYTYEDSSFTISPVFPNPSHATELDLNYRIPLEQGADNPSYYEGLVSAEAGIELQQAGEQFTRNSIANQALDLYYALLGTQARLNNAAKAVENATRLKTYIRSREDLGLSEDKDRLQAEAQLQAQQTSYQQIKIAWEQQRISLNRLMGRAWDRPFDGSIELDSGLLDKTIPQLIKEAEQVNPEILQNKARLKITESVIRQSRDQSKNVLDLVLSVGTRTRSGDSATGSVSEEDFAGQIRVEYREALDKSGLDAQVRQAQLDRTIAIEDIRRVNDDLQYQVASLVTEIQQARAALNKSRDYLRSEQAKFAEALQRYRQGRAETDRLIQYENELNAARLNVAQQEIELAQRINRLEILHGAFWRDFDLSMNTKAP